MIFFLCPGCHEELEADAEIKGTRMKCPACWKEIEVPAVSIRAEPKPPTASLARRRRESQFNMPAVAPSTNPFLMFLVGLFCVILGGIIATGVFWYRSPDNSQKSRPRAECAVCDSIGTVRCTTCRGTKFRACGECKGTGRRQNFRGETEDCTMCGNTGSLKCRTCGGRGRYDCDSCD